MARPLSLADRGSATLAWTVPLALALSRTSPHAQWRGDFSAARDLALLPMGFGGGLSTVLSQVASLFPVGSLTFRGALVAALALAVVGACAYRIALTLLRALEPEEHPSRWAAPLLAAMASLTATMTPLLQEEATIVGGAAIATAPALGSLALALGALTGQARRPLAQLVVAGLLSGVAAAERLPVGLASLAALVACAVATRFTRRSERTGVSPRAVGLALLASALAAAVLTLPAVLRGLTPSTPLDLGPPWLGPPPRAPELGGAPRILHAFVTEIGWVPLGLAALGAVVLVTRRAGRLLLAGPMAIVVFDVASRAAWGTTPGTTGVRLLALVCLACVSTAGLFAGAGQLIRLRVPAARASAVLLVAFHATLVALVAEVATTRADRSAQDGADRVTSLALDGLPPSAAISTDSPLLTWRLTNAQVLEGRRRDVLLLRRKLLARGGVARDLLAAEPVVEPLIRSIALSGASDEQSLAALADARPLFVDVERGWTARVVLHLSPDALWLRFRSDPPGKADRTAAHGATLATLRERFPPAKQQGLDVDTRVVLGTLVRSSAKVLLKQGDVEAASRHLADLGGSRPVDAIAEGGSLDVLFAGAVARLPAVRRARERTDGAERARAEAERRRRRR